MSAALAALVQKSKELVHGEQPENVRKKALIESGVLDGEAVKFLLKLKHGAMTTIWLALDGEDGSEASLQMRLITSEEELQIEEELMQLMKEKGFMPLSLGYNLHKISKTLAMATKPITGMPSPHNQPILGEKELLQSPPELLLALGERYSQFRLKHTPRMESMSDEDFEDIFKALDECEGDAGKMLRILGGLKLHSTQEMVIRLHEMVVDLSTPFKNLYTGQS